jgi:uncharacterized protein YjbI with pentapeptide repeats
VLLSSTTVIMAAGALVAVIVLWSVWWFWWQLPKRQIERLRFSIRDPKARADVEDNLRKTIGQLLGGLAILIAAGFALVQFLQQQQSSHDLLISNQVAKGFEQIGNDKVLVRVGGIYALENAMSDPRYYVQILEALSAYVRETSPTQSELRGSPPDTQAALTVIGRRSARPGDDINLADIQIATVDLRLASLEGVIFSRGKFNGVRFEGSVLRRARFAYADMDTVDFASADLTGADFFAATLRSVRFRNTKFGSADFRLAKLVNIYFDGADLHEAKITQGQLDTACGSNAILPADMTLKPCAVPRP